MLLQEAEFRAITHGICELLWLKKLLEDLRILSSKVMKLYCDNKTTINIARDLVQHDKSMLIEVDHHIIKEKPEARLIYMLYAPIDKWLADVLSKELHKGMFNCLIV